MGTVGIWGQCYLRIIGNPNSCSNIGEDEDEHSEKSYLVVVYDSNGDLKTFRKELQFVVGFLSFMEVTEK